MDIKQETRWCRDPPALYGCETEHIAVMQTIIQYYDLNYYILISENDFSFFSAKYNYHNILYPYPNTVKEGDADQP